MRRLPLVLGKRALLTALLVVCGATVTAYFQIRHATAAPLMAVFEDGKPLAVPLPTGWLAGETSPDRHSFVLYPSRWDTLKSRLFLPHRRLIVSEGVLPPELAAQYAADGRDLTRLMHGDFFAEGKSVAAATAQSVPAVLHEDVIREQVETATGKYRCYREERRFDPPTETDRLALLCTFIQPLDGTSRWLSVSLTTSTVTQERDASVLYEVLDGTRQR